MRSNDQPAVALDALGCLRAVTPLEDTTPEALATTLCSAVGELVGRETSVISCSVLGQRTNPFAMVMLRDPSRGGFLSGTGSADYPEDALILAVLMALGLPRGVLSAVAAEWAATDDVHAVSLIERGAGRQDEDDEDTRTHRRLVDTMPAPGRLAVTTEGAEHRVLCFPAVALAVSTARNAHALSEIDAWMATAEAMGP